MKALFSTSPSRNWKDPDEKTDKWKVKIEEQSKKGEDESQPSINLGLGIGGSTTSSSDPDSDQYHRLNNNSNSFSNDDSRIVKLEVADDDLVVENEREKQRSRKCSVVCFTEEQLQEFNTQSLIFKYVISGSPVPVQLLLPLWTSFSSPSYPRVSPLLLGFCRLGFDNQYEMDPEPGRCRRTDGKKWRCHQSVVPNEKYCERHMHRGRKRSRKLVESSSGAAPSQSGTRNIVNTSSNNNKPNNDFRSKFPSNQEQNSHLSTFNNPISSHTSARCNTEDKNGPAQVLTGCNVGKHNSIRMERLASSNISSGLDFSPKSVLQGGQKCLRVESCNINPNSDPGRCRRTDGKKWRCSNRVLPDQKYCAHHMNRGAKKPTAVTLSNSGVSIAAYKCASMAKFNGPGWAEMGRGVDTNLDFSLSSSSANHGGKVEDNHGVGGDGRSGSTSETTVTDDSIDVSNMITLSP